jgi:hypothetical protein
MRLSAVADCYTPRKALSASHVHLLIRGEGLKATMSAYLIQRIAAQKTQEMESQAILA